MLNASKERTIINKKNGWTVTTRDKELSAQFERTIGVTKDGCEIFTKSASLKKTGVRFFLSMQLEKTMKIFNKN